MRKCPQGKIINPKTGRCVKKDGRIGKQIVRKSHKSSRKSPKSMKRCPEGKIINPKTDENFLSYHAVDPKSRRRP